MIYFIVIMVLVAVLALVTIARAIRLLDKQWCMRGMPPMPPILYKEMPVYTVECSMRYGLDPSWPDRSKFIKRDIALELGQVMLKDGKIEFWDEYDSRDQFLRARRITGRIKIVEI